MSAPSLNQTSAVSRHLPSGWRWAPLGEVAKYHNGRAFKPEDWEDNGLPIIRIENLNTPTARFNHYSGPVESKHLVGSGDLLISWSASLDAYLWDRGTAVLNQHIFKVEENPHLVRRRYLYYAAREVMDEIRAQVHGATMRHVTKGEFEKICIPLPPFDVQDQVVAQLDRQLAAVARARAAAEAQLAAAYDLARAYLRSTFASSATETWPTRPLGDISDIASGITLGRKLQSGITHRVPYLRVANVKDGYLDLSQVSEIEATAAEITKLQLKFGDLLLTEGGDPDKLGRGTFWNQELSLCIHQNHIFRIRFHKGLVLPEFASFQVGSAYGKSYFLAHAKQTTGIATINQKVLSAFPFKLPPLAVQRQVASELAAQLAGARRARASADAQLATINALPTQLLRAAFSGQL